MKRKPKVKLPPLHAKQQEIRDDPARFKVVAAGRRFGKSMLGAALCVRAALEGKRAWWVAPSYPMSSVGWRIIKGLVMPIDGVRVNIADRTIAVPSGGSIRVRSADNPDSLRGEGLDFVVLDECSFMAEETWTEALRPALADRLGKALFISTPKGRNWVWRLWQRGNSGDDPEWKSWRFTTADNPAISPAEIEAARAGLPAKTFEQEFLAAFVDDAGLVFRNVRSVSTAQPGQPEPGHAYTMGVDWARSYDFTCLSVIDATERKQVAIDRFNKVDYQYQLGRLQTLCQVWKPDTIMAEANAMGLPLIEQLQRLGLPVTAFTTTQQSKAQIIEGLALAMERAEVTLLADDTQMGELEAYDMERLPGGAFRYNAPAGMHDDTVMALALAWHGTQHGPAIAELMPNVFYN